MKKLLLLSLVFVFVFAGMSLAAVKWSMGGAINPINAPGGAEVITPFQPICNANIDDKYDAFFGYSSITNGSGNDATTNIMLGGVMYMNKSGNVVSGPCISYFSNSLAIAGAKASDNTLTHINLGYSAKVTLISGLDLRADAWLLTMTSGKLGATDTNGSSIAPRIQINMLFNFM